MTMLALMLASLLSGPAAVSAATTPSFTKVLVIVLENTNYSSAVKQPYLRELMARGGALTNYHGITHPSQPNYIAMIAGDTMGVKNDRNKDIDESQRQVGDLLDSNGLSWAVYAEDYPGTPDKCFLDGSWNGKYARKHVPFLSFTSVQKHRCDRVKSEAAFDADAASLPAFTLYVPNVDDDGHDHGVGEADSWLKGFLDPKLGDEAFMKGMLVVVTFDEDSGTTDNRILTVLVGDSVEPGSTSDAPYNHYSLLKTIEKNFALGDLGRKDMTADAIHDIWRR